MNSINSASKSSPSNDSNGRASSVGRPPFNVSSNSSVSSNTTGSKVRKSTGGIAESKKGKTTNNNRNTNGNANNRQRIQKSFLEKSREEGRPSGELELIETIEREIVQGKLNVTWDSIGILLFINFFFLF